MWREQFRRPGHAGLERLVTRAGRGFDAGTHGTFVIGDAPAPRGGHTATLVPHDGKLAILILGGRNYDEEGHAANPHLGRDDAHLLVPRRSM